MLGIAAALAAIAQTPSPYTSAIEADLSRLLTGEHGLWFLPLASWSTLAVDASESRGRLLSRIVVKRLAEPHDPFVMIPLTPVAVSATMRGDREILDIIAKPDAIWSDRRPIVEADRSLARAIASGSNLTAAIERCRTLGLHLYEELAARLSGASKAEKAKSPLTARERQIAEAISAGKTNREIAESLVLSERTIEGHVANIFNKLNVSSRTQIAAWFIKSA
jgi:DNA-binding CsgD family transcriptional regulator